MPIVDRDAKVAATGGAAVAAIAFLFIVIVAIG